MSKTRAKVGKHAKNTPESAFINIFRSSKIELANEELRSWRSSFIYVQNLLKNKKNLSTMTKAI